MMLTSFSCHCDQINYFLHYFDLQGHLQGQKVISRSSDGKYDLFTNKAGNMCNTSFSCDFD